MSTLHQAKCSNIDKWKSDSTRERNMNCVECCTCFNEFTQYRDRNNNTKGRKRKMKPIKSSVGYTKDCITLKKLSNDNPEHILTANPSTTAWPTNPVELCEPLQNVCVSQKVFKAYNKMPAHDQKILNRMAMKRSENAVLTQNAWLAQKYWENEKYERELLRLQQEEQYKKVFRKKQEQDRYETMVRIEDISRRNQDELNKLRHTMQVKDIRLRNRLQNLQLQKELNIYKRREDEQRRLESLALVQDEMHLDDEMRKQEIAQSLEKRLSRADMVRRQHINVYMRRLKTDNLVEQNLHAENYREAQKFENFKHEQLKCRIKQKDHKSQQFVEHRRRNLIDTIERAKMSASLRDLVRRSISPENFHVSSSVSYHPLDRPISNLSFQSSIKLG